MDNVLHIIRMVFSPITMLFRFINDYFKVFVLFLIVIVLLASNGEISEIDTSNLYKVYLDEEIADIKDLKNEIKELIEADNIKGVLFVVNSPGGFVSESTELSELIQRLNAVKPVVTYAYGSLTSGSYYASIWSERIIANKGTIVGSIGVILDGLNLKKVRDTIGIESQIVKAGEFKEAGTSDREWTKEEREELEKITNGFYSEFVNDVAIARKLDITKQNEFANAHIFTAPQALSIGLIDEIGIELLAEERLMKLAKIPKSSAIWGETKEENEDINILENLMSSFVKGFLSELNSQNSFKLQ